MQLSDHDLWHLCRIFETNLLLMVSSKKAARRAAFLFLYYTGQGGIILTGATCYTRCMSKIKQEKLSALIRAGLIMFVGLIIFKLLPMQIFGQDIKFDASAHITIAMFALYFIWFFIDQNKSWRTIYFIFALAVISIISIQRILVDAHNDVGLLLGLLLSLFAIIHSQKKYFKDKFKF